MQRILYYMKRMYSRQKCGKQSNHRSLAQAVYHFTRIVCTRYIYINIQDVASVQCSEFTFSFRTHRNYKLLRLHTIIDIPAAWQPVNASRHRYPAQNPLSMPP